MKTRQRSSMDEVPFWAYVGMRFVDRSGWSEVASDREERYSMSNKSSLMTLHPRPMKPDNNLWINDPPSLFITSLSISLPDRVV
jgi:hypothetical protein